MNKKKILWIILLIIVIILIIALIFIVNAKKVTSIFTNSTDNTTIFNNDSSLNNKINTINKDKDKKYEKKELSDGVLYSIDGKEYKSDIVIGDNYFDTTINDIYLNPSNYMNKNIEIEGMYLENLSYTFVGRYTNSNLCPCCPVGYSYIEYQLKGTIDRELVVENDWIKIIGTLVKENEDNSNYQNYYYLEVLSLEVMNEKGQTTVTN